MVNLFGRFERENAVSTGARADTSTKPSEATARHEADEVVRRANDFRDRRQFKLAAEWYAKALALLPERNDLRVQLANMLKDSSQLAEAEAQYREALTHEPKNGDIALQRGRALKMAGRLAEAVASFELALSVAPGLEDAATELLHLGSVEAGHARYDRDLHAERMMAAQEAAWHLMKLRGEIDRALVQLPDLAAWAATPFALYGLFRELNDLPPPAPAPNAPSVTVVIDADAGSPRALHGLIASLFEQSDEAWRLVATAERAERADAIRRVAIGEARLSLAGEREPNTPVGTGGPAGALVLALVPGAMLHRHAVAWIRAAALTAKDADAFVLDEEIGALAIDGTFHPETAALRSGADYDAELETNRAGGSLVVCMRATGTLDSVAALTHEDARANLRFDLMRRRAVGHLPLPLVQRLSVDALQSEDDRARHRTAVERHFARHGLTARSEPKQTLAFQRIVREVGEAASATIGILIPTRDNPVDLERFVDSLRVTARRPERLTFQIIDNGSTTDAARQAFERLETAARTDIMRVVEPFNWSRLNNLGADRLTTDLVLFANDDMTMLSAGWDDILAEELARPEIGVVGARLLYPDDTIQHAGVIVGWQGAVNNDGLQRPVTDPGPCGRWHASHAVAAVVGAFLATRRTTFHKVGGFDAARLAVAFGDVDFCFKVRTLGKRVLYTPHITLHHYEAKSRGLDYASPERQARYDGEQAVMEQRWPDALKSDPGVHPFWHDVTMPHRLLRMPSRKRILAHIAATGAREPWRLPPRPG
jgi:O-antigen biosynthesis protein